MLPMGERNTIDRPMLSDSHEQERSLVSRVPERSANDYAVFLSGEYTIHTLAG